MNKKGGACFYTPEYDEKKIPMGTPSIVNARSTELGSN